MTFSSSYEVNRFTVQDMHRTVTAGSQSLGILPVFSETALKRRAMSLASITVINVPMKSANRSRSDSVKYCKTVAGHPAQKDQASCKFPALGAHSRPSGWNAAVCR
jgi:hypothetical protein